MSESKDLICPGCKGPVVRVRQTGCMAMNEHQFDAVKAGDYFCETCPDNGRGQSGFCYWWETELLTPKSEAGD